MIKFSTLKDNINGITKRIGYKDGKTDKLPGASIYDGQVNSISLDSWKDFADYLSSIPQDECIVLGNFIHGDSARIGLEDVPGDGIYRRSKYDTTKENSTGNFDWHNDYQLCCIDFDGSSAGDLTPEQLITELDKDLNGFADITKVVKYSSGAWLYNNGELVSEHNGFHLYFMCNNPDKIHSVFNKKGERSWLEKRQWLSGRGYIKNTKPKDRKRVAVSQMERCSYDKYVFSPERILFEATPVLDDGLEKRNTDACVIEGKGDYFDIGNLEPVTEQEELQVNEAVSKAKKENEQEPYYKESLALFDGYTQELTEKGQYGTGKEKIDKLVVKRREESRRGHLMLDHVLYLASGEQITAGDIMKNRETYHKQHCCDPTEPEYGTSTIAIIYTDGQGIKIYSHAHGGKLYLVVDDEDVFDDKDYWMDNFYMVTYDKKDEIYHVVGNKIEHYSINGFKHRFAGYDIWTGTKFIAMTQWWMNSKDKKCIMGDGFDPCKPIIYKKHGELVLNDYVPEITRYGLSEPSLEQIENASKPFVNHVFKLIHNEVEANILLDWFAYIVQVPSERPMFAPLITSEVRGVGKDMMCDILTRILGHGLSRQAKIEDIAGGKWGNMYFKSKLITISECGSDKDRYTVGNDIKAAITKTSDAMNIKYGNMEFGYIYCGLIFFSNYTSPFRLDSGDRRFFVTRCEWSKEDADRLKDTGYFTHLSDFYVKTENLHGLYHYFLNRDIVTNIKGDAPFTSTKEVMTISEPNKTEQFFQDLKEHPCRYWTAKIIKNLFSSEVGLEGNEKQYKHFVSQMLSVPRPVKIKGKVHRLKTCRMKDAERDNDFIRQNIKDNWGRTTDVMGAEDNTSNDSTTKKRRFEGVNI